MVAWLKPIISMDSELPGFENMIVKILRTRCRFIGQSRSKIVRIGSIKAILPETQMYWNAHFIDLLFV